MISEEILALLRCPETGQKLAAATPEQLLRIEVLRAEGSLRDRNCRLVTEKVAGGLVRADGQWLYPVRDDMPVLLVEDALPLGED